MYEVCLGFIEQKYSDWQKSVISKLYDHYLPSNMETTCTISRLKNKLALVSVLLLLYLEVTVSEIWEAKDFSNPKTDLQDCGRRGKQSFVCDPDAIITSKEGMNTK